MELLLGYEILESYKRLSYKEGYALAEFIDNSTQSYRNNKTALDKVFDDTSTSLKISIDYNNSKKTGFLKIVDNAFGMDENALKSALTLGKHPENDQERSKYGLGLKTAAFWFGDVWEIQTTQLGNENKYSVKIDLNKILSEEKKHNAKELTKFKKAKDEGGHYEMQQFKPNLDLKVDKAKKQEHGTTIFITKLNRLITSAKAKRCKNFLKSIYRKDLQDETLELTFQGEPITWKMEDILSDVLTDEKGKKYYRKFKITINGKKVVGWAAVLKHGSREVGGFALLQAERVIETNYKPTKLYGDQEGGTNNLVNQRLIGEIYLDGFEVSHTKDQILFSDDEETELDDELFKTLGDLKRVAEKFRHKKEGDEDYDLREDVSAIFNNLKSTAFRSEIFDKEVLPEDVIQQSNEEVYKRLNNESAEKIIARIGKLEITVIMSSDSSIYDPYLIVRSRSSKTKLTIVINENHTYWSQLDKNSRFHFLVNCIYDGLAEWKAYFWAKTIDPDTIKMIKDHFLRLELKLN